MSQYGYGLLLIAILGMLLWNVMLRRSMREQARFLSDSLGELDRANQASDQLRAEQRAMLENNMVGIVKVINKRVIWANSASRIMLGYEADELTGFSISGFFSSEEAFLAFGAAASPEIAGNKTFRTQVELVRRDGASIWVDLSAAVLTPNSGESLWFFLDMTQRRETEQRLRQLSRLVEQSPMAMVITDLDGTIEYANPRFCEITGYTEEEVLGKNPRVIKSNLTPSETYLDLWQTLKAGHVWRGELINRKKSGDIFVEQEVIAPVLDSVGHATHYVALKEDVTLRKQADVALQASLQEKVALLNEVHHRVKNNLQVITSLLRLEASRSTQNDTRVVLKDMKSRIFAMAQLHETLYRTGTFASVDLGVYVKQLALQAFRVHEGGSGSVRLVLDLTPVNVGMDQATPCGLLVNELLSNCLKHGFPNGRAGEVVVQLRPSGKEGCWCLSVRDTGVGLPVDFEEKRTQSLGLQLVSDLALQLGGVLECANGPGASFTVEFPIQVFPEPD
jgi:PAS domain S-box-containing protein